MAISWITEDDLSDPSNPLSAVMAESASWILYKLTGEKYTGFRTSTEWYGHDLETSTHLDNDDFKFLVTTAYLGST